MKANYFFLMYVMFCTVQCLECFIPSKETCAATARRELRGEIVDINDSIACMISGFKNIYWGSVPEIDHVDAKFLPLEKHGIKQIVVDPRYSFGSGGLLLYTPAGEKNAKLFLKMLEQAFKRGRLNEYLARTLLGYSQKDVEDYYKTVINRTRGMRRDKREAAVFLARETPAIEEEIRKERVGSVQASSSTDESLRKALQDLLMHLQAVSSGLTKKA